MQSPIVPEHFWIFSGPMLDYTLSPIHYLEETTGAVVTVMVEGNTIDLPSTWYILVADEETTYVDTVQVYKCAKHNYKALLMSPDDSKSRMSDIKVVDLKQDVSLTHPMMEKGTMMCYPLGPDTSLNANNASLCMCCGPYDLMNKYLQGAGIPEILF